MEIIKSRSRSADLSQATNSKMKTSLRKYFDGNRGHLQDTVREHMSKCDLFKIRYGLSIEEERRLTHERVRYLFTQVPEIQEEIKKQSRRQRGSMLDAYAFVEITCMADVSVGVKCGVLLYLFGGALIMLGTEEQQEKWFQPIADWQISGMFAMSERSHGSNVRGIRTQAQYNPDTEQFTIHTPDDDAAKMYIGNALYGNYAVVFAQLYLTDGQCKGPHVFVMRIRDENGILYKGVRIEDMGLKEGCNGVDNGIIWFDHVRIPRENMLARHSVVTSDGRYVTSIEDDNTRFNTMLGALLGTRLSLCFQAIATMKVGLEVAIKYSLRRRQFQAPGEEQETLIMNYQTHQLRLMPHLATVVGLTFVTRHCAELLDVEVSDIEVEVGDNRNLQALAAGLKAYCTWEAVASLQAARECTGGMGYIAENRIAGLKADADVFVTFEGDNVVMLQQVSKELLSQYYKEFKGRPLSAALHNMSGRVSEFVKSRSISFESVLTLNFILNALEFKEAKLLRMLAFRLYQKVRVDGEVPFQAWNSCLHHVTSLGLCHVQRLTLHHYILAVERCEQIEDKNTLLLLSRLYAIHLMYSDRSWYLENHYISTTQSSQIRDEYIRMCQEVRGVCLEVVEAFGVPSVCLHAPIAGVRPEGSNMFYYYPDEMMDDDEGTAHEDNMMGGEDKLKSKL